MPARRRPSISADTPSACDERQASLTICLPKFSPFFNPDGTTARETALRMRQPRHRGGVRTLLFLDRQALLEQRLVPLRSAVSSRYDPADNR
jgi:hypothetical protein